MNRLFLVLLLCNLAHSSPTTQPQSQSSQPNPPSSPPICLHGRSSEFSVTAYPGSSCAGDVLKLIELLPKTPYPLSCPSSPLNTKCFPITETLSTSSPPAHASPKWNDVSAQDALSSRGKMELRDRKSRRRTSLERSSTSSSSSSSSSPTTITYIARSVQLTWPDEMSHAVFFADDACAYVDGWRDGEVWHLERREGVWEQCVGIGEEGGLWGSVEFMREGEWVEWRGRMGEGL